MAQQITGHFTCDNSYSIWVGNANQVITKLLEATNTLAQQISGGEDLKPFIPVPECHLYICAWSDDAVFQGFLGSFTGAVTIHSGDPRWRVLPTSSNRGNNQFPTAADINQALAAAQPGDWKVPFAGAPNGGPPWNTQISGISTTARWMWHDSGKDTSAKYPQSPYVPFAGFNHDEFLIFRIPCTEFEEQPVENKPEPKDKCCCVVVQCGEKPAPVSPTVVIQEKKSNCGSCVFEVRLQRFSYVSGSAGALDNWAEISFTSHVDGNMYNFPTGNGSYVRVGKRQGSFWKGWYPVNARVGVVEVACGCPRQIDLMTEMVENPQKEKGLAALLEGGRPWGASDVNVVMLRCGEKPAPVQHEVGLELGGNRTEDLRVRVEYRFSQITACNCCGCDDEKPRK